MYLVFQAVVSPTSSSVFEPSSGDDKFCIEEGDIEGKLTDHCNQVYTWILTLLGVLTYPTNPHLFRNKEGGKNMGQKSTHNFLTILM